MPLSHSGCDEPHAVLNALPPCCYAGMFFLRNASRLHSRACLFLLTGGLHVLKIVLDSGHTMCGARTGESGRFVVP